MVWCTGAQCDGQGKKKSGGQHKRKKGQKQKKTIYPAKNPAKKKNEKSHQHLETDPRVSL
jgi:hypothetical protein